MKAQNLIAALIFSLLSTSALAVPVVLDITFDEFPDETYFGLWESGADTSDIFAGIPYDLVASSPIGFGDGYVLEGDFTGEDPGPWHFYWDLVAGDYEFALFDGFGDGICCDFGLGAYSLSVGGDVLFAGGEFGSETGGAFTVSNPVPAPASLALLGLGLLCLRLLRRA